MRKWVWAAVAVVVAGAAWFGYPVLHFAYRWHYYGPPALQRAAASDPTTTLRYGPAAQQYADLRVPAGAGPFPVAVTIHGGCWDVSFPGGRTLRPIADLLAKRGVATFDVEYRVVGQPGGGWPGTMRDVGTAIDSLRGLARRYPLDLNRVVVIGHSAGAQLALWSAMRDQLPPDSAVAFRNPLLPKGVVAVDGPGALAEFIGEDVEACGKSVIVPFMGGTPRAVPGRYRDASPQDHLPLGARQYLVRGAFADLMMPYIARARAAGDPTVAIRSADARHFNVINPTQPQGQDTVALIVRAVRETALTR